jgi:ketosteroid isomerase-like protein
MVRAFNEGDVEAIVAECDATVEWEEQPIPGMDPIYRGHEGVSRWAATVQGMDEELGSLEVRFEGLKEADDAVIASIRIEGEGMSSGLRVQMHPHLVFTFRDGKVVRRQVFQKLAKALEAVGPRE